MECEWIWPLIRCHVCTMPQKETVLDDVIIVIYYDY